MGNVIKLRFDICSFKTLYPEFFPKILPGFPAGHAEGILL